MSFSEGAVLEMDVAAVGCTAGLARNTIDSAKGIDDIVAGIGGIGDIASVTAGGMNPRRNVGSSDHVAQAALASCRTGMHIVVDPE